MDIIIETANPSDAEEILSLQRLAYISEAELYKNYNIEPMVQSLEEIQEQIIKYVFLTEIINAKLSLVYLEKG